MAKLTEKVISQTLEFAYDKAISGVVGLESAADLAESYVRAHPGDKRKQADALIRRQILNGATSGFLSGLGGLITLPVAIPLNIASVLLLQVRMIVAIAVIGGYDPKDEKVKSIVFSCLVGSSIKAVMKEVGINMGKRIAIGQLFAALGGGTIVRVNRMIALKLVPKFATGVSKWVPVLGGLIGGALDAVWVNDVGTTAKLFFIESNNILEGDDAVDAEKDAAE